VLDHATRIRTDFFPLALGLAAAAVAMRGWRPLGGARGAGRAAGVAACLGLLAGLAVGSKLNGALVAIMVGAWCVVAWLAARREPAPGSGTPAVSFARGPLVAWAVSGAPCVALFVLFSPHLWPAPVENLRELLEAWEGDVAHQKDLYGERLGRADSLAGHLALASRAVVGEHEPFRAWLGAPIGGPLVALGLAALALRACRLPRMRGTGGADPEPAVSARLALVWILVGGVGAALWLPFGRDNFFLAFAAPVAVAEGVALALPVELARRRLGAREPRGTEAP
jgi:hypothetical protein